ncbi:rho-related GTP-binding protein RhoA-B-like [Convolutriloba macropyga]|uniref:rho-related GTP-binding protein RhoA-B-like n=1 Tax=Convolutriloba macropyga TaxID=536237 RepID=UPI003F52344E
MKIVKAVLIGDGSVGKTCLVHRLTDDAFSFDYNPTVFDMTKHTLTVSHGSVTETVQIELWDTAGQEEFQNLRPLSYKDVGVFILCYSVDSITSFRNCTDVWMKELRDYYPKIPDDKVSLVLVALKTDLRKDMPRKTIPSSETAKLARRIGTDYYHECSAKDENGYPDVQKVFQKAALATLARGQKKTKCFIL